VTRSWDVPTSKMSGLATRRTDWRQCSRNGNSTGMSVDKVSVMIAKVKRKTYRDRFYTASDFEEMAKLGLNSIRVPIGCKPLSSLPFLVGADDPYTLDRLDRRLPDRRRLLRVRILSLPQANLAMVQSFVPLGRARPPFCPWNGNERRVLHGSYRRYSRVLQG